MKITVKNANDYETTCDALILPVLKGKGVEPYALIDGMFDRVFSKAIDSGEFKAEHNEMMMIHSLGRIKPRRILLVGLGEKKELTPEKVRQAGGKSLTFLRDASMKDVALSTSVLDSIEMRTVDFIEGAVLGQYKFGRYKKDDNPKEIKSLLIVSGKDMKSELAWMETVTESVAFAKDLVNTPSNDMTPTILEKFAKELSGRHVSVKIIERKEAEKLGMGAYVSVAKGSMEPSKFIVIQYKGNGAPPIVLIGKSITFDSGGISLKPADGMEKMKYDMAGGAAVLAVMKAVIRARMPLNVFGIMPATENLPSGTASKPGDVVKAMNGKTIEIISTDAEGRLLLADALGYAEGLKPSAVIDLATLTGAVSVALGGEAAGLMGNDEALMGRLKTAGESVYERLWQLPLYDEYKEYIKSDVADIKNSGGRSGGLVTAGVFLKEFAGSAPWAHIDIAGTAWVDKDKPYVPKGASGMGVRLILEFLRKTVQAKA